MTVQPAGGDHLPIPAKVRGGEPPQGLAVLEVHKKGIPGALSPSKQRYGLFLKHHDPKLNVNHNQ